MKGETCARSAVDLNAAPPGAGPVEVEVPVKTPPGMAESRRIDGMSKKSI
jgi:hypothetical protein